MLSTFECTTYATLAQDIADAHGGPACFTMPDTEKWFITEKHFGSPLSLLWAAGAVASRPDVATVMVQAAGQVRAGKSVGLNNFIWFYPSGESLFLARTIIPEKTRSLLELLFFDSLVLRLLSELSGLKVGGSTIFMPCTSSKALGVLGAPLPAPQPVTCEDCEEEDGEEEILIPTPNLGEPLRLLEGHDPLGAVFFEDLIHFFTEPKIPTHNKFIRRVLQPLREYQKTRATTEIARIRDPYLQESMFIYHRGMH